MFQTAYTMLGGKDDDFEQASLLSNIQLLKAGLPTPMLDKAASLMGVNKKYFISLIGRGTGNTYSKLGCLSPQQSERMLMIIDVLAQAEQYHGHRDIALQWLNNPCPLFNNDTPLTLLDTAIGIKLVSESLNRLSHGMTA